MRTAGLILAVLGFLFGLIALFLIPGAMRIEPPQYWWEKIEKLENGPVKEDAPAARVDVTPPAPIFSRLSLTPWLRRVLIEEGEPEAWALERMERFFSGEGAIALMEEARDVANQLDRIQLSIYHIRATETDDLKREAQILAMRERRRELIAQYTARAQGVLPPEAIQFILQRGFTP